MTVNSWLVTSVVIIAGKSLYSILISLAARCARGRVLAIANPISCPIQVT